MTCAAGESMKGARPAHLVREGPAKRDARVPHLVRQGPAKRDARVPLRVQSQVFRQMPAKLAGAAAKFHSATAPFQFCPMDSEIPGYLAMASFGAGTSGASSFRKFSRP